MKVMSISFLAIYPFSECRVNCLFVCLFCFVLFCFFQGEGVAYRGRVLIELETKMDTQPTQLVEDVLSDDIIRVQVCRTPEGKYM